VLTKHGIGLDVTQDARFTIKANLFITGEHYHTLINMRTTMKYRLVTKRNNITVIGKLTAIATQKYFTHKLNV